MNVLLVHNYYGSGAPSGENVVFEAERTLLASHGVKVASFTRHSDIIRNQGYVGLLKGAASTPWNFSASRSIRAAAKSCDADVVHAHNTFPLISPSFLYGVEPNRARVLTLHNYRFFCAAGVPMRDGQICTQCLDTKSSAPSLVHGCYRRSRFATFPLAASISLHRTLKTWDRQVDAFIVLTEFQKELCCRAGLPPGRVHVKPNFYPGNPHVVRWEDREGIVFAGRLSEEKGVETLVKAWSVWGDSAPQLTIIGDGPLRQRLEDMCHGQALSRIKFLGQLSAQAAQMSISAARLLIVPSECYEGFPMVLREAFAFGTAVAVSNLGPLPSLVSYGQDGLVFPAGDPRGLCDEIRSVWSDEDRLRRFSERSRRLFDLYYNEDKNFEALLEIYESAILVSRKRRGLI